MGQLKVRAGGAYVPIVGGYVSRNRSMIINGDWHNWYLMSQYIVIIPMDTMGCYPNGITITSWYLKASVADPTTEINANLRYCDAQGTGAFPGANIVLVDVLDSTTGNSQRTDMSGSSKGNGIIPAGKSLYIQMDTDPTDTQVFWTLTINYTAVQ
jgi:hypothetical protein